MYIIEFGILIMQALEVDVVRNYLTPEEPCDGEKILRESVIEPVDK